MPTPQQAQEQRQRREGALAKSGFEGGLMDRGQQVDLLAGGVKLKKVSRGAMAADEFAFQLRAHRMNGWVREHMFAESIGRKWRFDFAHTGLMLAVEIEGLRVQNIGGRIVCTGRHSTVDGYREDCRKYAAAVEIGWSVLRFVQDQVKNGEAIAAVERVLARRGWVRG